jgi:hypothetical protein
LYGAFDGMSDGKDLWKPHSRPRIHWDPSLNPNGYVSLDERGTPVIATTLGVYHGVHDFLYRLFSTSDLVTQIGDPSREEGTLAELVQNRQWLREPPPPDCPVRLEASHIAAECAIALVFYHEAGHVIIGHFAKDQPGRSFQERGCRSWLRNRQRPAANPPYAEQFQELQADRCALAIAFHHLRTSGGVFPKQIVPAELAPMLPNLVMIAQVALHIVLADATLEMAAVAHHEHPHPMTRFIDAIGSYGRGGFMKPTSDVSAIADAFRLAALMRKRRITPELLEKLKQDALVQHKLILEAAPSSGGIGG